MKKIFMVLAICLVFFSGNIVSASTKEKAKNTPAYYQMVEIQRGDTIWGIAKTHLPEDRTTKDFVKEIYQVNQLLSAKILPGQSIIIPIYEKERESFQRNS